MKTPQTCRHPLIIFIFITHLSAAIDIHSINNRLDTGLLHLIYINPYMLYQFDFDEANLWYVTNIYVVIGKHLHTNFVSPKSC